MQKHRLAFASAWLLRGWMFLSILTSFASAADRPAWLVDGWGIEDGLPQNSIISIAQSHDGYLWLGTLNGLVRFDGIHFATFNESNTRGLNSGRIVYLFEDSRGILWLGTESAGAAMIRDGELRNLDFGRGSRAGRLVAACEDADGAVWLYTADGQLGRHLAGHVNVWQIGPSQPSLCRALAARPVGGVWVGVDWGVYDIAATNSADGRDLALRSFMPATGKLDFLIASSQGGFWQLGDGRIQLWITNRLARDFGPYPWKNVPVSAACEDQHGNLVVGTLGAGVYCFDESGAAANVSTNEGLSNNYILSLLADHEGSLWVGTDGGGLNRIRQPAFEVAAATHGALVQSVSPDGVGGLWLARDGGVLFLKDNVPLSFGPTNGLGNAYASTVLAGRGQQVWVGARNGGLFLLRSNRFEPVWKPAEMNRNIFALYEDRQGNLWVGAQDGLLCWSGADWKLYTTNNGLSANAVRAIVDDHNGDLWVGTEGGGLNRWHAGQFTAFHKKDGLPSDNISALCVDTENILWVGTESGGLARLSDGNWSVCTTHEGLASDSVGYLVDDAQGWLWIGSYAGLMRVSKQSLADFAAGRTNVIAGRNYDKRDGLPTSECAQGSQPAAARTGDGTLWFSTIKGLVTVNPAQLVPNTNPPPVVIESVLIDGRPVDTNALRVGRLSAVTISPGRERLEIHYASLNLAAPKRARFRYQLIGHEEHPVEAGDSRVAAYPKLPPGEYTFRVTAGNEDGRWNLVGASLKVTVLPPFWRKWWFLALVGAGLLGWVIGGVHYFSTQKLHRQLEALRQKEALEKERSRIARDLHDQLGANLTRVAMLGEFAEADKNLPVEVEAHAKQISATARETTHALDEIVWAANPANDTLESLVSYACKLAQDYCALAGLRYRLEVPDDLPAVPLPPEIRHNLFLAFKEAVNNMVKHARATEARIRLRLTADTVTFEIEDNGRGPGDMDSERARARNGLRNMRKRMEDIHGEFSIAPVAAGGTLVRLTAPLKRS